MKSTPFKTALLLAFCLLPVAFCGCSSRQKMLSLDEYNQTFDKSAESSSAASLEPGKAYTEEEFEEAAGTDMEFTPLDEYNQANSFDSKGS